MSMKGILLAAMLSAGLLSTATAASEAYSIDDYNRSLAKYGVPFYTQYPASFYTGFAPRVEEPNRIHFRVGRGNQVRLTAVLDEYAVLTYLFGLQKRYQAYDKAQTAGMFVFAEGKPTPGLDGYRKIVDSSTYNIRGIVDDFQSGKLTRPEMYQASLDVMRQLNPGRVFDLSFDLQQVFRNWKQEVQRFADQYQDDPKDLETIRLHLFKEDYTLVLTDALLFGRTNAVYLSEPQIDKLVQIVSQALHDPDDDPALLALARDYFIEVTEGRYSFSTVVDGELVPALRCDKPEVSCSLSYPEFTAVYPNGSVIGSTTDRQGNTINMIRNSALMTFIERRYHDVDHIRKEGYYGFVPKMDWEYIGNGAHNPGVSHWLQGMPHLYQQINIPEDYAFVWVVSRGPVSSGCVRMSSGHLLEVRNVFPSDPKRMTAVKYFGNHSADYDLFDIDGDGTIEVIGVDYDVAYSLRGLSGDNKRRGKSFSVADTDRDEYYQLLYGAKQYTKQGEHYVFENPFMSHHRKLKADDRVGTVFSRERPGKYTLYEQNYEQDKAQIFRLPQPFQGQLDIRDNTKSTGKQMVRVLGRINSCGPFDLEWELCNEKAFEQEFDALLNQL